MAENSGFFNAELVNGEYDREYLADSYASYFARFIGNGVFITPATQLQVVQNSTINMTVQALIGSAFINGYWYENTAPVSLTVAPASGVSNRIDSVVLRLDLTTRGISVDIVTGDYYTTTAQPKAPVRDTSKYELVLCHIDVPKGTVSIPNSKITDTRTNSSLCGFVYGVVDQIDLGDLFIQYESEFSTLMEQWEAEKAEYNSTFDVWFDSIVGKLGTEIAGNLQLQIDTNDSGVLDTQTDIFIQSTKGMDAVVEITKIEGKTTITPPSAAPISHTNVGVIASAVNFSIISTGRNIFNGLLEQGFINSLGAENSAEDYIRNIGYVSVKPEAFIRITRTNTTGELTLFVYSNKKNLNFKLVMPAGQSTIATNLDYEDFYVRFTDSTNSLSNTYQIEIESHEGSLGYTGDQFFTSKELLGLPNGVCDTIEKIGDKWFHVQRLAMTTMISSGSLGENCQMDSQYICSEAPVGNLAGTHFSMPSGSTSVALVYELRYYVYTEVDPTILDSHLGVTNILSTSLPQVTITASFLTKAQSRLLEVDNKVNTLISDNTYNENLLINGDFQVWQRGTSFSTVDVGSVCTADRWIKMSYGSPTYTKRSTGGISISCATEFTNYSRFNQVVELPPNCVGKPVTLSIRIKSNIAKHVGLIVLEYHGGTVYGTKDIWVNTGWGVYTLTTTVNSTNIAVGIGLAAGSAGYFGLENMTSFPANCTVDIEWVKLELGEVATPFRPRLYAEELALCQRYFYKSGNGGVPGSIMGVAFTTQAFSGTTFPVTMRVTPSLKFKIGGTLNSVRGSVTGSIVPLTTIGIGGPSPTGYAYMFHQVTNFNVGFGYDYDIEADAEMY